MSATTEKTLILDPSELLAFCGRNDHKIRMLQAGLEATIRVRGNEIVISGEPAVVERAAGVLEDLLMVQRSTGRSLSNQEVQMALRSTAATAEDAALPTLSQVLLDRIPVPNRSRHLRPMTPGQKVYVDAVRQNDIVFAIGPAGTGKTYLAVALAVWNLTEGLVRRIILVRPAVEAGERLGFLPGDIAAKFDPFVRPLYDALYDMMEPERVKQYLETGVIEIAPLAFMRGRTLNDAFVILDEGQNTTMAQMKMFLTRLGVNSKAVVTGDVTQVDLPADTQSGLVHVQKVLKNIKGIAYVFLENHDVVRHDLVQRIVRAYESHGSKGA